MRPWPKCTSSTRGEDEGGGRGGKSLVSGRFGKQFASLYYFVPILALCVASRVIHSIIRPPTLLLSALCSPMCRRCKWCETMRGVRPRVTVHGCDLPRTPHVPLESSRMEVACIPYLYPKTAAGTAGTAGLVWSKRKLCAAPHGLRHVLP